MARILGGCAPALDYSQEAKKLWAKLGEFGELGELGGLGEHGELGERGEEEDGRADLNIS